MATQLSENTLATLKVLRESEQGAFLDGGTGNTNDDILLHKEQQTSAVAIGDEVPVFLYRDPKGRLTASMRLPAIKEGQIGYVEVINTTQFGCFVEVGTERGIFMPHAEMRGRPQLGEKVWVRLYTDKSGRLAVSMDVDDAMRRAAKPAIEATVGQIVRGAIYNFTPDGAFFITPERWIAFLHRSEMTRHLKVGELIKARVTYKREDGRINVSMRPVKETALTIDGDRLLQYLLQRNGRMPYSDKTSAEIIKDKFGFSKAAFKRAVGHLMKSGKVIQEEGWTLLTETGRVAAESISEVADGLDTPKASTQVSESISKTSEA
ncbi:CvfB family protein [Veillonella criceti]|uniref:Conserved virulence factor B n=1 Tax=Veillonella criceti TaxID=103891 RepID=A0A380NGK5_9FIRM|nr:S1-like domain-containing RNA-binding protein [Veillonella criceti]SUP40588.1 Conserved virulence factor B [Veillonella criceti]